MKTTFDKATYVDGIIDILKSRGITDDQITESNIRDLISMAYDKGREWKFTAISVCKHFGIPVDPGCHIAV